MGTLLVSFGITVFLIVGGRIAARRWESTLDELHPGVTPGAEPIPAPNIVAFGSAWNNAGI